MRVVVVGGGIVGLASAAALAERGADVVVCEKDALGAGSTGRANGGIRAQFTTPVSVALSRSSQRVWEAFAEDFGVDIEFRRVGYLFLARTAATADRLRENVTTQRELGVESVVLDPEAAAAHCPGLRSAEFVAAAYCPTDGFADPHLALQGYARRVTDAGVEVRTGTPVTDILLGDGRVAGVVADGERLDADAVVNATNAWGARVAAMAGVDLPVSPRRRVLMVADPDPGVPADAPLTADLDGGVHFRPERDGRAVVGGHVGDADPPVDPDRVRDRAGLEWVAAVLERAADVTDRFGPETTCRRTWAGAYGVTPDHHPVVDEAPPGLVHAVGFNGHGFMHAPATGAVVAELVCDGAAATVDVSPLSLDRFERGDLLTEGTILD